MAFEVKVSATVPYTIECNLSQLDSSLFETLYLACFQAVRSDDGIALTDVIERLEKLLDDDAAATDEFFQRLHKAGYRRQRRTDYANLRLVVDKPRLFLVSEDFPKITNRSFHTPPDARIRGVRYSVQLAGLDGVGARDPDVLAAMRRLV